MAPEKLKVKFVVSDIRLLLPKEFFDRASLRASVFVGRKGRSDSLRYTRWFSVTDPCNVPTFTSAGGEDLGSIVSEANYFPGDRCSSAADVFSGSVNGVELEFGKLNEITYDVEMRPMSRFEGEWVFNSKTSHPLNLFVKAFVLGREGDGANDAVAGTALPQSERVEGDGHEDEGFDGSEPDLTGMLGDGHVDGEAPLSGSISALGNSKKGSTSAEHGDSASLSECLIKRLGCRKIYLYFPKDIDLASVANTKLKCLTFSERLKCKDVGLLGTTLTFTVRAVMPTAEIAAIEHKLHEKQMKAAIKRQEEEAKLREKERKRGVEPRVSEGEDRAHLHNASTNSEYVTLETTSPAMKDYNGGAAHATEANPFVQDHHSGERKPKKKGLISSGLITIKGIFVSEKAPAHETPYPVTQTTTSFPYLFCLDNFKLTNLFLPPQFYRGVHLRLATDSSTLNHFPRFLLDTSRKEHLCEETVVGPDGCSTRGRHFDFGKSHFYLAHHSLCNILGFDTMVALQAHEDKTASASQQERHSDPFHLQFLNTGERFLPLAMQPAAHCAGDAQAEASPGAVIVACLMVPAEIQGMAQKCEKERGAKEKQTKEKHQTAMDDKHSGSHRKSACSAEAASDGKVEDSDVRTRDGVAEGEHEGEKTIVTPNEVNLKRGEHHSDSVNGSDGEGSLQFISEGPEILVATEERQGDTPKASANSILVPGKSGSYCVPSHLINEEWIPQEGTTHRIRFSYGEELHFRARRIFLPSVCSMGEAGSTTDVPFLRFMSAMTSQ